ncbi:hypothetical protein V5799_024346 [Amblyomma americanum]|uniref:Uncharacterized protein n=1 Tax=Amblyomma americanum TaxID=6943 RepID=A0AAQ4ECB4_AMBAM
MGGPDIADLKREFRKEIRELKHSLEFVRKQYENLNDEYAEVKKENAALKANQEKLTQELERVKKSVHENSQKIVAQDKYSRIKNIELKGIPHAKEENHFSILGKVKNVIGEPISDEDIEIFHRVPTSNASAEPNIVVVFNSRTKRDAVLEKARKKRFTADKLGFKDEDPVYVNEHLCPQLNCSE